MTAEGAAYVSGMTSRERLSESGTRGPRPLTLYSGECRFLDPNVAFTFSFLGGETLCFCATR